MHAHTLLWLAWLLHTETATGWREEYLNRSIAKNQLALISHPAAEWTDAIEQARAQLQHTDTGMPLDTFVKNVCLLDMDGGLFWSRCVRHGGDKHGEPLTNKFAVRCTTCQPRKDGKRSNSWHPTQQVCQ